MTCLQEFSKCKKMLWSDKDDSVKQETEPELPPKIRNYFICKSLAYTLTYFVTACQMANIGICLPDIIKRTNGNYASLATAMSVGSFSTFIVSPILAFLTDRFPKRSNIMLATGCLIGGLSHLTEPFMPSVPTFGLVHFTMIASFGILFTLIPPLTSSMWKRQATFPLHLISLGFPIGGAVAPLISKSFISSPQTYDGSVFNMSQHNDNSTSSSLSFNFTERSSAGNSNMETSQIEIPFLVFSIPSVMFSICYIIFDVLEHHKIPIPEANPNNFGKKLAKAKGNVLEFVSPKGWADGDFKFGLLMLIGLIVYFGCLRSHGSALGMWGFSFAIENDLKFDKDEAAYLISTSNIMRLVSRVVATVCSLFLPIQVMLFIEVVGTTVSCALLSFGLTTHATLWVYLCSYKFLSSPMWATMAAWMNNYVTITVALNGWIASVASIIDIGSDNLIGYLLQNISQISLMYACLGLSSLGMMSVIYLQILASRHGNRFDGKLPAHCEISIESLPKESGFVGEEYEYKAVSTNDNENKCSVSESNQETGAMIKTEENDVAQDLRESVV